MIDYQRTNIYNQKSVYDAEYILNSINQIAKQYGRVDPKQVYNILRYAYPVTGNDEYIKNQKDLVIKKLDKIISKTQKKKDNIKSLKRQEQGEFFTHTNITFKDKDDVGVRDLIKLYIPILPNNYSKCIIDIYKFAIKNQINIQSKVSAKDRIDNFIVRVSNKEDAMKIIEFCNSNKTITNNLGLNNPFIPQLGGIGISRDTYGKSYNKKLSEEIAEFINSQGIYKDRVSINDLYQYVSMDSERKVKGSSERFMTDTVKKSLESIISNTNPLDNFQDRGIRFEYDTYHQYTRHISKDNLYKYVYKSKDGVLITEESNYILYTKLQAMNCMEKLYEFENGHKAQGDFCISGELLEALSKGAVDIIDRNANSVVAVHDTTKLSQYIPRIESTYSYLYSQFAIEQFGVDENIARNIEQRSRYRTVLKKEPEKRKESFLKRIFKKKDNVQALPPAIGNESRNFKNEYRVEGIQNTASQYSMYEQNKQNNVQYEKEWNR